MFMIPYLYRMVLVATVENREIQVIEKLEQDNSFQVRDESGVFSEGTNNSTGGEKDNWEYFADEVVDASIFSLPDYFHSSNLEPMRPISDISSISQLSTFQNGQGNRLTFKFYKINHYIGRIESTHIGSSTSGQPDDDWMTPRDHGRNIRKLELEGDLEDQFFKMEFENSFCQDTDASFDYKFTVFPKSLNPGFDLMCLIKVSLLF